MQFENESRFAHFIFLVAAVIIFGREFFFGAVCVWPKICRGMFLLIWAGFISFVSGVFVFARPFFILYSPLYFCRSAKNKCR